MAALPTASIAPPTAIERLARENAYLKQRNAQLQEDVTSISAEAERLRQIVDRLHGRSVSLTPNSLARANELGPTSPGR